MKDSSRVCGHKFVKFSKCGPLWSKHSRMPLISGLYISQCLCINSEAFESTICRKSTDNIFDKYFVNFSEFTWRDHIDDDIDGVHPAVPWVEDHWLKIDRTNMVICKNYESPPWGVWCWGFCQRCVQLSAEQWRSRRPARDATCRMHTGLGGFFYWTRLLRNWIGWKIIVWSRAGLEKIETLLILF